MRILFAIDFNFNFNYFPWALAVDLWIGAEKNCRNYCGVCFYWTTRYYYLYFDGYFALFIVRIRNFASRVEDWDRRFLWVTIQIYSIFLGRYLS